MKVRESLKIAALSWGLCFVKPPPVCVQTHGVKQIHTETHSKKSTELLQDFWIKLKPHPPLPAVPIIIGIWRKLKFSHLCQQQLLLPCISITLKVLIPVKIMCFCVFCSHSWKTRLHKLPPFSLPGTEWWWALLDLSPALALNHDVQIGLAKQRRSMQENIADCVLFRWKQEVWPSLADTEEQLQLAHN